jgi:hypothetical protein
MTKGCAFHLLEGDGSHATPGAEGGRGASREKLERFARHGLPTNGFLGLFAIGFDHERDRLTEVFASFVEGITLSIRAGEFLDERDVTSFGHLEKNGGEFPFDTLC